MKIASIASTALVFTSLAAVPAMPASAQTGTTVARMQAACDALKPADQLVTTGSVTNPNVTNITYAARVNNLSSTFVPRIVTGPLVLVTPAATTPTSLTPATFVPGSDGRRGGSPNIHGEFVATATYAGAVYTQTVTTYHVTSYTFGCAIDKTTPGTTISNWRQIDPTLTAVEETLIGTVTNTIVGDPVIQQFFSDGVICNSPGSKGGTWRAQNGYTGGNCNTAYYLSLPGKTVTSNSVPNFAPVHGQPAGADVELPFENLNATPLVDTDPDTVSSFTEEPAGELTELQS